MDAKRGCVVVGAGPGNGLAFARRFGAARYQVATLTRDAARLSDLAAMGRRPHRGYWCHGVDQGRRTVCRLCIGQGGPAPAAHRSPVSLMSLSGRTTSRSPAS